jgi:hypothetical protein
LSEYFRPAISPAAQEIPMGPDEIWISLLTDRLRDTWWWKGLHVVDINGHTLGTLEAQESNHGGTLRFTDVYALTGARVVFSKAKLLGVHTDMYQLDLGELWNRRDNDSGCRRIVRIEFEWFQDSFIPGYP